MTVPQVSSEFVAAAEQQQDHPLQGRWLFAARLVWLLLTLLSLAIFIVTIPATLKSFRIQARNFTALMRGVGLDADLVSLYIEVLSAVVGLGFPILSIAIASVIFWRRAEERMAFFVSLTLVTFSSISATVSDLVERYPNLRIPIEFSQTIGVISILLLLYLFPDGRFVPRWTRFLAAGWIIWILLISFAPIPQSPQRDFFIGIVTLIWITSAVFAQIYRYLRVSGPLQRQQTKWVIFAFTLLLLSMTLLNLPPLLFPSLMQANSTPVPIFLGVLTLLTIQLLSILLIPISIGISILHYRLWDIDPLIQRTIVYGVLTTALALLYIAAIVLLQRVFRAVSGLQRDMVIVFATLSIAALFNPLRIRLQAGIDRRFYRERVDFRRAFTEFSREVRTIIDLPRLQQVLIDRVRNLLHISHAAVFLRCEHGSYMLVESCRAADCNDSQLTSLDGHERLQLDDELLARLQSGAAISRPRDRLYPLLVPLLAPRPGSTELIGVLALGPRLSGQSYSRSDQLLLTSLADQAGTAIYVAQLIQEREAEARRREEAERYLEAHRNSPVGRAEALAAEMLERPQTTLVEIHHLAQTVGRDVGAASLLANLPLAFDNFGKGPYAGLAEGFHYLVTSQASPEMLPVGLRRIIDHLELRVAEQFEGASEALGIYRICHAAQEASSMSQIIELLPMLQTGDGLSDEHFLSDLARALGGFQSVAKALHAYERVDTVQDKLAYLAGAVDRLRRIDHLAWTRLGSADRPVIRRIAETWLGVITGVISELQTRAQIVCKLLTRHTWQADVITLALNLRNEGRGAAINLKISLDPTEEYSLLSEVAVMERLAPGEEAQVELRVRPRLAPGVDQFRARFIIHYSDPRGSDQVEHFADVVRLLAPEGEFRFIPNPYVVGTPLQPGSPLFFGREDVIAFIQENLAAAHRNNLVLIGQRRTGKTSLLKQLPVRLGDDYLPVYLDGQALGFDPGLPNFFLTLATEMTFALEDRGFAIEPPELEHFLESPASSFEYQFLQRVRQAIGDRHIVLLLDEFEELESAVRRGNLDSSIFGFLRHLMQHSGGLSVVFCGTHRLEELAADYWSVLFNISLYKHVGFLSREEAVRLVTQPVAGYGMRYDDLALEKIWRVTAGHPYFLQLLCHSLVNRHNRTQSSYATIADVNAALDEILASGEAHFVYLWAESSYEERLALTALSRMIPLTGQATAVLIVDYLTERGVQVDRRALDEALHRLTLRDILVANDSGDASLSREYRWRLGLLGLWVEKYRSLSRVVDEAQR